MFEIGDTSDGGGAVEGWGRAVEDSEAEFIFS